MTERKSHVELKKKASRLKLTFTRDHLEEMIQHAADTKMSPFEVLNYFLSRECEQRNANHYKQAMQVAHFPSVKTLEGFDFSKQPSINPGVIRELEKLEWIEAGENVALFGAPGVGKTHLAIAFGRLAVERGYSVRFYSAANLMALLEKASRDDTLDVKLKELSKASLLIVDEIGYLPYTPDVARLFFLLVARRYEKKSILITSNRPPSEWKLVFADATATTAILDRLLHHCTAMTIRGDSYRLLEQKRASLRLKQLLGENKDEDASPHEGKSDVPECNVSDTKH